MNIERRADSAKRQPLLDAVVAILLILMIVFVGWLLFWPKSGDSEYTAQRTDNEVKSRTEEVLAGLYEDDSTVAIPKRENYTVIKNGNLYTVSNDTTSSLSFTVKYCDGKNGSLRTLSILANGTEYDSLYDHEIAAACINSE